MYQVSIIIDRAKLEAVEQILLDHGAVSVTLRDAADQPVLEPLPGEMPLWPQVTVTGLFDAKSELAPLRCGLADLLPNPGRLEVETVVQRDWARAWMDDFKPMRFGRRLRVCPTGYEHLCAETIDVRLDPGLAFGTGTH